MIQGVCENAVSGPSNLETGSRPLMTQGKWNQPLQQQSLVNLYLKSDGEKRRQDQNLISSGTINPTDEKREPIQEILDHSRIKDQPQYNKLNGFCPEENEVQLKAGAARIENA